MIKNFIFRIISTEFCSLLDTIVCHFCGMTRGTWELAALADGKFTVCYYPSG